MDDKRIHSVNIEQRKKVLVTAVGEVVNVTARQITLTLCSGEGLKITGEGLKMGAFSKQSGAFSADGRIDEVTYQGQRPSLIRRILK